MAKIFVSYSRKDIEFAKQLTAELQKSDLDFWIDWEGIPPTVDWWREIEKGIEEADVFVFLISPDSAQSKVCGQELETAVKNAKRIIPLVVRDIKGEETPTQLSHLNWIFFRQGDDFEAGVNKLITAIQTDYEWAATHRRLQVKALDWARNNKESGFLLRGADLLDAEQDLAANTSKDPHPTDLQREYVFASRRATDRQRRLLTGISIGGVIVLAALAIFGFVQAGLATQNANESQRNAATAQAASTLAFENAATASANEQKAEEQARIALARQLAAQAQSIYASSNSNQIPALLYIQSMRLFPTGDAANFLLNENLLGRSVASMAHGIFVNSVAFSPDGKFVVSSGCDKVSDGSCTQGSARVWEATTGIEIAQITSDYEVSVVAFSPDGKLIVSSGCDNKDCTKSSALVWEAATGIVIAQKNYGVNSVAFSPNGNYVVLGSSDATVHVLDAAMWRETARISYGSYVTSVAFSPDGKYVVSGGCDKLDTDSNCSQGAARVWEVAAGKEIAYLTYNSSVTSVAFSPAGKYVVFGSWDGNASVIDATIWEEFASLSSVTSAAFSSDGTFMISSERNGVQVWDVATWTVIARMTHGNYVTSVDFSPDGKFVISGGCDKVDGPICSLGSARVWEAAAGKEIARMTSDNEVTAVAFSPNGKYVVSTECNKLDGPICSNSSARVWEPSTGTEISKTIYQGEVNSVTFSPDGNHVVSGGCDSGSNNHCSQGSARVWQTSTGSEIARMKYSGTVYSVAFSPAGKYIISGSQDFTAQIWEVTTENEIAHINHDNEVTAVAFSPNGKYVVSSSLDGTARVWEANTGNEITRITSSGVVNSVAFSRDGKYIVSGGCDTFSFTNCSRGSARVWEAATGKEIARMNYDAWVYAVSFSPNGKYVVSAGCDNDTCSQSSARVWEAATGDEIARMNYEDRITSVAFSPNGKYVVSGGCDKVGIYCSQGSTRVWEAATGDEIARMNYDGVVSSVAFSPDGENVISGGCDAVSSFSDCTKSSVRVWESATGKEIARMNHVGEVTSIAFSPDGELVVSSSYGIARVWRWQPEDLIANACLHVTRNLTRAEWKQFLGEALSYPTKQKDATCPNLPIEPEVSITLTPIP